MSQSNHKPAEDDPFAKTRASFGDHLQELRSRLIKSIYGLVVAFVICLYFGKDIFALLAQPLLIALRAAGLTPQLYVASLPEAFITYIKVALYSAIFLASPWIFYQLWGFVAAGLYPHERRYIHFFVPFAAGLFILGGAFFISVVAPLSCNYFIRFGANIQVPNISDNFISRAITKAIGPKAPYGPTARPDSPELSRPLQEPNVSSKTTEPPAKIPLVKPWFTLQKYVSLVVLMALVFSLAFQTPLVVFFLGRLSLVSLKTLQSVRKYVFFGIVVLAAAVTPADVFSQLALALPMYLLYELGILLLRLWPKRPTAQNLLV